MTAFSPDITIQTFPGPETTEAVREIRAIQNEYFMDAVQHWYVDELGLSRITPDPYPRKDPEDLPWRLERFQKPNLQFIGAFRQAEDGAISADPRALVGLILLERHEDGATTEIVEWDNLSRLKPPKRSNPLRGLGKALLCEALQYIDPAQKIIAEVVATNRRAQAVYRHYGFRLEPEVPPFKQQDPIFDITHRRFYVNAGRLQRRLGVTALDA